KRKKKVTAAPATVIQIHRVDGHSPVNGVDVTSGFTVVGFVKPAAAPVTCNLYRESQATATATKTATATHFRWTLTFTSSDTPSGTEFLLEALIPSSDVVTYVTVRVA